MTRKMTELEKKAVGNSLYQLEASLHDFRMAVKNGDVVVVDHPGPLERLVRRAIEWWRS